MTRAMVPHVQMPPRAIENRTFPYKNRTQTVQIPYTPKRAGTSGGADLSTTVGKNRTKRNGGRRCGVGSGSCRRDMRLRAIARKWEFEASWAATRPVRVTSGRVSAKGGSFGRNGQRAIADFDAPGADCAKAVGPVRGRAAAERLLARIKAPPRQMTAGAHSVDDPRKSCVQFSKVREYYPKLPNVTSRSTRSVGQRDGFQSSGGG